MPSPVRCSSGSNLPSKASQSKLTYLIVPAELTELTELTVHSALVSALTVVRYLIGSLLRQVVMTSAVVCHLIAAVISIILLRIVARAILRDSVVAATTVLVGIFECQNCRQYCLSDRQNVIYSALEA